MLIMIHVVFDSYTHISFLSYFRSIFLEIWINLV